MVVLSENFIKIDDKISSLKVKKPSGNWKNILGIRKKILTKIVEFEINLTLFLSFLQL